MSIRIITLNCWSGRIGGSLTHFLRTCGADVLCLQEVNHSYPRVPHDGYVRTAGELVVNPNLFEDLTHALPDHVGMFYPAARGYLHDGAQSEGTMYGIAAFIHRRLLIVGNDVRFAAGKFRPRAFGNLPLPRNVHSMRLFDPISEKPFVVSHMHGMWIPYGDKLDTPTRVEQASIIVESMRAVRTTADATIVCGDFNVLPNSKFLQKLRAKGMVDLVTTRGFTDTHTSYYPKEPRYADYMFVSQLKVLRFDVLKEPEVSDHRPLVLDFE